jgi:hypothetical protein
VDYAVNRKYFITRLYSPIKYGKKFVNGNIGPSMQVKTQDREEIEVICEKISEIIIKLKKADYRLLYR